jgi:hypothetical protein
VKEDHAAQDQDQDAERKDEPKADSRLPSLRLPKPSQPGSKGPSLPAGLMRTSLASLPAVKPAALGATPAAKPAIKLPWASEPAAPSTGTTDPATMELDDLEDDGPPTDNVPASALDGVVFNTPQGPAAPPAESERSSLLDATPLSDPDEAGPDEATMMAPGLLSDSEFEIDAEEDDDLDAHTQIVASPLLDQPHAAQSAPLADAFEESDATSVVVSQVRPAPQAAPLDIARRGTERLPAMERPVIEHQGGKSLPFETGYSGLNARPKPTLLEFQYGAAPTAADPVATAAGQALPEDDDDLDGLKTEMLFNPFTRDLVAPKLRAVEGPALGQEFFVNGLKCTVGRGENNTLMVADLSMSRHHFEVIRNPDESFWLRDLGSANGTSLQGTRIKEVALFDGDRIEAGQSTFIFSHAASPPQQHRHMVAVANETMAGAPSPVVMSAQTGRMFSSQDPSTRLFTLITIIAGALCLPLIGLLVYLSTRPAPEVAPAQQAAQQPVTGVQSADLFMQGVQAVKLREWDQASAHFTRAKAMTPSLDIAPQLARITREQEAMGKLEAAQKAGEAGDLERAHALASQIPAESVYAEEARRWVRRARVSEVDTLYTRAQQEFTAGQLPEALATIDELLKTTPDHQATIELRARVIARRDELERLRIEQEARAAREAETPVVAIKDPFAGDKAKQPVAQPTAAAQADWSEGLSLYRSEKFGEATAFFEKVAAAETGARASKAKRLVNDMRLLQKSWKDGKAAAEKKDWDNASKRLDQALRADGRMGGAHKKALGEQLATAIARQGLALLAKEDYRQARKQLLDSRKLTNTSAASELDRGLEDKATSLYIKAASARKGNDAQTASNLCRTIMLMTPSSSPSYAKAQKLLLDL